MKTGKDGINQNETQGRGVLPRVCPTTASCTSRFPCLPAKHRPAIGRPCLPSLAISLSVQRLLPAPPSKHPHHITTAGTHLARHLPLAPNLPLHPLHQRRRLGHLALHLANQLKAGAQVAAAPVCSRHGRGKWQASGRWRHTGCALGTEAGPDTGASAALNNTAFSLTAAARAHEHYTSPFWPCPPMRVPASATPARSRSTAAEISASSAATFCGLCTIWLRSSSPWPRAWLSL